MIKRESLESILGELLPDSYVDPFSIDWILRSRATEESKVYRFLK